MARIYELTPKGTKVESIPGAAPTLTMTVPDEMTRNELVMALKRIEADVTRGK
jgi:hypothetical protein